MTQILPIILTIRFDAQTTARLQAMRDRYFPPRLNLVPAHLTLFHHLPGNEHAFISATVEAIAVQNPFVVTISRPQKLGRGVALQVESDTLRSRRSGLAKTFETWLTPQDRAPFRPHITVQNKVTPEAAALTYDELNRSLAPFTANAEGIELWHYCGGPWSPLGLYPFTGKE